MLIKKLGYVYILSNKSNSTLYVGVASELINRIYQHKTNYYPRSFTARYNVYKLVFFRLIGTMSEAIAEEKRLKAGSRHKKIDLILSMNPDFKDLYDDLVSGIIE